MNKLLIILVLVALMFFSACETNVFSPDPDGITRFNFEDIKFEYDWNTHTMFGVNPSESSGTFVFIVNDCRVNERTGNRLRLGPYHEDSFTRFYSPGVNLLVEYNWDGINDKFYLTLE